MSFRRSCSPGFDRSRFLRPPTLATIAISAVLTPYAFCQSCPSAYSGGIYELECNVFVNSPSGDTYLWVGTSGSNSFLDFQDWNQIERPAGTDALYFNTRNAGSSSGSTRMVITNSGNVGIGTTNPQNPLSVNGIIQAKEVVVNTNWSDYVFDRDYRLDPLSEVASYVNKNHHLPGIPSAQEVKEKGISLGEMQAKMLAKIEELTLHMIAAEKENADLRERLQRLDGTVTALRAGVPESTPKR